MPGSIAIDSDKYSLYVKYIGGLAGGPLIYIDSKGVHRVPDPRPLDKAGLAAVKQIEEGLAHLQKTLNVREKSAIGA
ncbi:hypothetical protein BH09PSE3_BH09PSE3_24480 [soil metagenome]